MVQMKTSVRKEWARAGGTQGSSKSALNQSHRYLFNSRDPRLSASRHITPHIQPETSMIQPAVSPSQRVTILKIIDDPRDGLPLLLSHSVEHNSHDSTTQQAAMISLPSGQPIHTFRVTTDPSDGHSVILSHTVEVTGHAANSVVDPSNSTKVGQGQPSGSDVKAREAHDNDDQTIVQMMFETELKKFVTKQIEKRRDQDQSRKELHDLIVHKTVDKIMRMEKNFPTKRERIGEYFSKCKRKIKKLIQDYFHKYEAISRQ